MEITTNNIKDYVGKKVWSFNDRGCWVELAEVNDTFCVLKKWGHTYRYALEDLGEYYLLFTEEQEDLW